MFTRLEREAMSGSICDPPAGPSKHKTHCKQSFREEPLRLPRTQRLRE